MSNIESKWVTESGLLAVVVKTDMGHRCGYIEIPKDHSLYQVYYDDVYDLLPNLSVHGGLTFSGDKLLSREESGSWWIGYDCAHYDDMRNPKSLEFCKEQCESLAEQVMCINSDEFFDELNKREDVMGTTERADAIKKYRKLSEDCGEIDNRLNEVRYQYGVSPVQHILEDNMRLLRDKMADLVDHYGLTEDDFREWDV